MFVVKVGRPRNRRTRYDPGFGPTSRRAPHRRMLGGRREHGHLPLPVPPAAAHSQRGDCPSEPLYPGCHLWYPQIHASLQFCPTLETTPDFHRTEIHGSVLPCEDKRSFYFFLTSCLIISGLALLNYHEIMHNHSLFTFSVSLLIL